MRKTAVSAVKGTCTALWITFITLGDLPLPWNCSAVKVILTTTNNCVSWLLYSDTQENHYRSTLRTSSSLWTFVIWYTRGLGTEIPIEQVLVLSARHTWEDTLSRLMYSGRHHKHTRRYLPGRTKAVPLLLWGVVGPEFKLVPKS